MNQKFNNGLNSNNSNLINIQKIDDNNISSNIGFVVYFRVGGAQPWEIKSIDVYTTPEEKVSDLIEKYRTKSGDRVSTKKFLFNAKKLNPYLTCSEAGLFNNAPIFVVNTEGIKGAGGVWYNKEINIKFIKISKHIWKNIIITELYGLLKLCFLKRNILKIK